MDPQEHCDAREGPDQNGIASIASHNNSEYGCFSRTFAMPKVLTKSIELGFRVYGTGKGEVNSCSSVRIPADLISVFTACGPSSMFRAPWDKSPQFVLIERYTAGA